LTGDPAKLNLIIFWVLIILALIGKEEVSLVLSMFGLWLIYKFKDFKVGLSLFTIGVVWFVISFLVLIPMYKNTRSIEFEKFLSQAQITTVDSKQFFNSNFFLHRYSQLGNSYIDIATNIILHPINSFKVSVSTEDINAVFNLLAPLAFLPVLSVPILLISLPEVAINVLSNQNIFAIDNHRVSMFIPVVILGAIYSISKFNKKWQYVFSVLIVISSVYISFKTNNLLLIEISKKVNVPSVFASTLLQDDYERAIADPYCINKILKQIPKNVSYTGPNYMGAQTSLRKTNAVYPMRFYDAQYVAIDVKEYSVHANEIGITNKMQNKVTQLIFNNSSYKLIDSCKSLFLFKNQ